MHLLSQWLRVLVVLMAGLAAFAHADDFKIGVFVMHGKGGSPTKHVAELVSALEHNGVLVANLEMPWSGQRDYDVDVAAAEQEVLQAIAGLRQKGATKVFVSGHSQGGVFALYFGSKHRVDGIIAIAPGGNVASAAYRERLGDTLERARSLVKEGKGMEKTRLADFEGAKGVYPVYTTPRVYLAWFEPEGAMNQTLASQGIPAELPVLFIAPTNDYPGLLRVKDAMFGALPKNPRTKLFEPNASHLAAPGASAQEILDWTRAISKS